MQNVCLGSEVFMFEQIEWHLITHMVPILHHKERQCSHMILQIKIGSVSTIGPFSLTK